jgi:hypothetical protein
VVIALLVSSVLTYPAMAHAILEQSQPANGATIPAGATSFTLTFNSRIDQGRSLLTLTAPDQSKQMLAIGDATAPNLLTTSATLVPGRYVLHWQVLSVDGHITRGQFSFSVSGN